MRALWLDFQRAEPGRRRAGTGLLVAGLVAATVLVTDYLAATAEVDEIERQVSRLRRDAEQVRRSAGAEADLTVRSGQRQGIDEPASASHGIEQWESMFKSLEAAADENVTLLLLNTGASDLQIGGEARNMAAAMDYVKRLQSATAFSNPHLTQSEVVQEHPQHPVRFALAAQWRESGREGGR